MKCEIRTITVPYTEEANVIRRCCSLDFYIPQGIPGREGGPTLSEYAYIYNVGEQTVPVESDVNLSSNGVITSGILHTANDSEITLVNSGIYSVWFHTTSVQTSQFSLFKNGLLVGGTTYGSGQSVIPNNGMVIVSAGAGDVITIRNHTSLFPIELRVIAGGTLESTNASILIQKIA